MSLGEAVPSGAGFTGVQPRPAAWKGPVLGLTRCCRGRETLDRSEQGALVFISPLGAARYSGGQPVLSLSAALLFSGTFSPVTLISAW